MKDGPSLNVVEIIRQNCLQFYITAAEEIHKRLSINDIFLSKLRVFLPHIALSETNREISYNDVSSIAKTIGDFDEDDLKREWFELNFDLTSAEKHNLKDLNFDDMWIQILKRQNSTHELKYPNLTSLLNSIRSLPNFNADPERVFSLLTDTKTKKRNKLSATTINAICVLKSALKTRGETPLTMQLDVNHLALMSSNKLYTNISKRQKSSLQLYAADDDASTSCTQ